MGNSSSGMIESSSFHIPVINIGIRQYGRDCADNVIQVDHDENEIYNALVDRINEDEFRSQLKNIENPYGKGIASKIITDIISKIVIDSKLIIKKLTY